MKKKWLAVLLALLLVVGCTSMVFADEEEGSTLSEQSMTVSTTVVENTPTYLMSIPASTTIPYGATYFSIGRIQFYNFNNFGVHTTITVHVKGENGDDVTADGYFTKEGCDDKIPYFLGYNLNLDRELDDGEEGCSSWMNQHTDGGMTFYTKEDNGGFYIESPYYYVESGQQSIYDNNAFDCENYWEDGEKVYLDLYQGWYRGSDDIAMYIDEEAWDVETGDYTTTIIFRTEVGTCEYNPCCGR